MYSHKFLLIYLIDLIITLNYLKIKKKKYFTQLLTSWFAHWQDKMVSDWKLNFLVCVHVNLMTAKLLFLGSGTWNTGNRLPLGLVFVWSWASTVCAFTLYLSTGAYLPLKSSFFLHRNRLVTFSLFPPSSFMSCGLSLCLSFSLLFLAEVFICLPHSHCTVDTRYYFHLEWRSKNFDSFFQEWLIKDGNIVIPCLIPCRVLLA